MNVKQGTSPPRALSPYNLSLIWNVH